MFIEKDGDELFDESDWSLDELPPSIAIIYGLACGLAFNEDMQNCASAVSGSDGCLWCILSHVLLIQLIFKLRARDIE